MIASVVFAALAALVVAKGRWWTALTGGAGVAAMLVTFGFEPSESFQQTTAFDFLNAGLNVALYGGFGSFVYGIGSSAKPGSWWQRRHAPPPPPG